MADNSSTGVPAPLSSPHAAFSGELVFDEPYLELSAPIQLVVRVVSSSLSASLVAATLILLASSSPFLVSLGALFALFAGDLILHLGSPFRSLSAPLPNSPLPLNIAEYLSPAALAALARAYQRARFFGGSVSLNLAAILAEDDAVRRALERLEVDPLELVHRLGETLHSDAHPPFDRGEAFAEISEVAERALREALAYHEDSVAPLDLFVALVLSPRRDLVTLFTLFDLQAEIARGGVSFARLARRSARSSLARFFSGSVGSPRRIHHRTMNRAWSSRPTPTLDAFSTDLTDLARADLPTLLVGHLAEYARLTALLSSGDRPYALLVGFPGVGRDTIAHRLASALVTDEVPLELFDRRLVALDVSRLIADADQDLLETRVARILDDIEHSRSIVLYIPDLHAALSTSPAASLPLASLLHPLFERRLCPVLASTTPAELKRLSVADPALGEFFSPVAVAELEAREATYLLTYRALSIERDQGVLVTYRALETAVSLAGRYFGATPLPGSAQSLLEEAVSEARRLGERAVRAEHVVQVAERRTNIPIHSATREEARRLLNLDTLMGERLIGQREAVLAVSRALKLHRSGLTEQGRPIATFLFVGPTGVGKTQLAKTLAEIYFGSRDAILRFDMSEYQEPASIYRLIGSPDGKVAGSLTDAVLDRPYRLILLDEFEKTHRSVLNIFLQVFDDARLTDNLGRVADFSQCIIVATSNAESSFIAESVAGGMPAYELATELKRRLVGTFAPELLNRFSEIVAFRPLSRDEIVAVTRLELTALVRRLEEEQGITVTFGNTVVFWLAEHGYDPVYGARALLRFITTAFRDPLATALLSGEVRRGARLASSLADGHITFTQTS